MTQSRPTLPASLTDDERDFARSHRVAHLATADAAGVPHVVPICYALVGDLFYFIIDDKPKRSRTGLKRLRNIADNPKVAVVIDAYDEDWSRLAYLLIQGHATRVEDVYEYATGLDALRQRYPQYRSMQFAMQTHPLIRIEPERRHMWRVPPGS
jgi:PPOX class probable F420-dependent enzyme